MADDETAKLPWPITDELIAGVGRGEVEAQGRAMDILESLKTGHAVSPILGQLQEQLTELREALWKVDRLANGNRKDKAARISSVVRKALAGDA